MSATGNEAAGGSTAAGDAAEEHDAAVGATTDPAMGRRGFMRAMAGDAMDAAAAVASTAIGGEGRVRAEAAALAAAAGIGFNDVIVVDGPAPGPGTTPIAAASGYRSPYRIENGALIVLDQRRWPETAVEVPCLTAPDAAAAIRDRLAQGAGTVAAVGAYGLALGAARRAAASPATAGAPPHHPAATLAAIHADANLILAAAPWIVPLRAALDRLVPVAERACGEGRSVADVAAALRAEADAYSMDQLLALSRISAVAGGLLVAEARRAGGTGSVPEGRLRLLVHGPIGALAFGQLGPVVAALQSAANAGVQVHVWVAEGRPPLSGVRTANELAGAGIGHGLVPDSAVGSLLAGHAVDVVLLGTLGVTQDGDVEDEPGAYAIALLAARHGVPVYVIVPAVARYAATGIVPTAWFDVTPADLVSGFVTEDGVAAAPLGASGAVEP